MTNQSGKGSAAYLSAALYIIGVYAFVPLLFLFNQDALGAGAEAKLSAARIVPPLLIPVVLGLLNLSAVTALRKKTTRDQLLNCAMAVKYALIPFFLIGGCCIALALLLMFTPVVIMVFVGPALALTLGAAGWIVLLGSAPFSVGYLVRANREGIHPRGFCILAGILQFFFTVDVITMTVAAFREKKWIKATVMLVLILLAAVIGCIAFAALFIF